MKRVDQNVAGRPKPDCARRDVAGMSATPQWTNVASFQKALGRGFRRDTSRETGREAGHAFDDPMAAFAEDVMLYEDFADFLSDGDERVAEPSLSTRPANSDFRERLRGRLWRTFVQTHLRDGGGRH